MKKQTSLISVILVFYNASILNLEAAIKSVLTQNGDWELLLVDDGATNHSTDLAHNYALLYPQHIRYLAHDRHLNLEVSASYNLGMEAATGSYFAFLSANQTWLPNKLSYQRKFLTANSLGAVFGLAQSGQIDIRLGNRQEKS